MTDLRPADTAVLPSGPVIAPPAAVKAAPRRRIRWKAEPVFCGIVILVFVAMALVPSLFTAYDPIRATAADRMLPPSAEHPFGTDQIGRDMFARVVHGARLSLQAGLLATAISLIAGSLIGLVAGFVGGGVDTVVSRICDAVLAIPGLLLSLALISALGNGSLIAAVAIGIGSMPTFIRVMRAEALRVSTSVYVEAARASGALPFAVLRRHILPNAVRPVIGLAVLEFGQAMLVIGALSYLGFGEAPPTPEWGALISTGQPYIATAWWLSVLPGLVLAGVVLVVNRSAHIYQGRA